MKTKETKECSRCEEEYPIDDFYDHHLTSDGKESQCRYCCAERSRRYEQRKSEDHQRVSVWIDKDIWGALKQIAKARKVRVHDLVNHSVRTTVEKEVNRLQVEKIRQRL